MASAALGQQTGSLRINLFDGARQPANLSVFLQVFDGNQKQIVSRFFDGPNIAIPGVPFYDNLGDLYRVVGHAKGHQDTGLYPVRVLRQKLVDADLMFLPENGGFHFDTLPSIRASNTAIFSLLGNGLSDNQVQQNFSGAMEGKPKALAAVLNIATAMQSIPLPDGAAIR